MPGTHRGGGGKLLANQAGGNEIGPQRMIDIACAQEALRRLTAQRTAAFAGGRAENGKVTGRIAYIVKCILRDLHRSEFSTISANQRRLVCRYCTPEYIEKVTALHTSEYKPVELPKRPPQARKEEE